MCNGLSGFASLVVVLIVVAIAVLVVHLVIERRGRAGQASVDAGPGEHAAVALLKDRLARGEVDIDEFERRLFSLNTH